MRKNNKKGFILMETLAVVLTTGIIGTWISTLLLTEHHSLLIRLEEEKAYYAAVSAVRLMAESMMGEDEISNMGDEDLEKTSGILYFQSEDKKVSVPVSIWIENKGNERVLYSEAGSGISAKTISLTLEYDQGWYPVKYESMEKVKNEW